MSVDGYEIPVHQSLQVPILMAGAPRSITILNATIGAALTLGLRSFWGVPICLLMHTIAVFLTKRDPDFFEVIKRFFRLKTYYDV